MDFMKSVVDEGGADSTKYGLEDLKLKSKEFYQDEVKIHESSYEKLLELYNELGPFDYGSIDESSVKIVKWLGNRNGWRAVYFGQMEDDKFHGVGILVSQLKTTLKFK